MNNTFEYAENYMIETDKCIHLLQKLNKLQYSIGNSYYIDNEIKLLKDKINAMNITCNYFIRERLLGNLTKTDNI